MLGVLLPRLLLREGERRARRLRREAAAREQQRLRDAAAAREQQGLLRRARRSGSGSLPLLERVPEGRESASGSSDRSTEEEGSTEGEGSQDGQAGPRRGSSLFLWSLRSYVYSCLAFSAVHLTLALFAPLAAEAG